MSIEYKVDGGRARSDDLYPESGIYVRAKLGDKWGSYDIAHLERESLVAWLKSRGGDNPWAENCVLLLLGHEPKA